MSLTDMLQTDNCRDLLDILDGSSIHCVRMTSRANRDAIDHAVYKLSAGSTTTNFCYNSTPRDLASPSDVIDPCSMHGRVVARWTSLLDSRFPNLKHISISHITLQPDAVACIAKSMPSTLRCLLLNRCGMGEEHVLALAGAGSSGASRPHVWRRLEVLSLLDNQLCVRSAAALALGCWPVLRSLLLGRNVLGSGGAAALAGGSWPKLAALGLSENELGDDGVAALAHAELPNLVRLGLCSNGIGPAGAAALAAGPWTGLTVRQWCSRGAM